MPYEDALGIEFVDRDLNLLQVPKSLRSIRFKMPSFLNSSKVYEKFREMQIARTEKKLEKSKDSFKDLEFSPRDFSKGMGEISTAEKEIMKEAKNIARLEEKLNILKNIPVSPKFVSNRAIKLKDNMIKNARFNSHNVYSIPDENKGNLFSNNTEYIIDSPDKIIAEETNNTANEVKKMMESKNIRDDIIVVPDRESVQKTINDEFAKHEDNIRNISAEEVADVVEKENLKGEIGEAMENNVNEEQIKRAVSEAVNDRMRVSQNAAGSAKIERYSEPANDMINEDGTYRLTRDQIDEDFRKTYINERPEEVKIEKSSNDVEFELEEDLIGKKDNGGAKEMINVIPFEEIKDESSKEAVHFDYDDDSIQAITKAVDKAETKDDIQVLLERVSALKRKQTESKMKALRAKEKAEESETMKEQAKARLEAYKSALEEDISYNGESAEKDTKTAENNERLIEAMLSMIHPEADEESIRTK